MKLYVFLIALLFWMLVTFILVGMAGEDIGAELIEN